MSFLLNLVRRAHGDSSLVRPRVPGLFEPETAWTEMPETPAAEPVVRTTGEEPPRRRPRRAGDAGPDEEPEPRPTAAEPRGDGSPEAPATAGEERHDTQALVSPPLPALVPHEPATRRERGDAELPSPGSPAPQVSTAAAAATVSAPAAAPLPAPVREPATAASTRQRRRPPEPTRPPAAGVLDAPAPAEHHRAERVTVADHPVGRTPASPVAVRLTEPPQRLDLAPLAAQVRARAVPPSRSPESAPSTFALELAPAPTPPEIHVTIGRVDVRATTTTAPASPVRAPAPRPMSLEEHLRQRSRGGR